MWESFSHPFFVLAVLRLCHTVKGLTMNSGRRPLPLTTCGSMEAIASTIAGANTKGVTMFVTRELIDEIGDH